MVEYVMIVSKLVAAVVGASAAMVFVGYCILRVIPESKPTKHDVTEWVGLGM